MFITQCDRPNIKTRDKKLKTSLIIILYI